MGKRILQLTEAELAEIQASGFLPVSVPSETFRLAINHLLANWKPWATEPTKGSLEISTTQYPATIPVKIGGTICGYLVPAPPTNETGVVLSWVDEETGFAWREDSDHATLSAHVGDTTGNPHGVTKGQVGLGNVENYKAVSVVASQGLANAEKVAARGNIDAAKDLASLTIAPIIVDTTATLTIEQGGFASIDLTSETALTSVDVVLTNTSGVEMPVWWFKIKSGSDITLSVEIGSVAVGWLGSAITNIALGKTLEVSVADGVACGGELV